MSIQKLPSITIKRQSLTEQLYEELERQIVIGTLPPGTKLSEENVARAFGVSRSPAREAIMALERIGLASRSGPRDRVVATPAIEKIRDLFEAWWILDTGRTCIASLAATEDDHAKLRRVLADMESALERCDHAVYKKHSEAYHELLYGRERNQTVERITTDHGKLLAWLRQLYFEHVDDSMDSLNEHREIADAFIDRDLTALIGVLRGHILRQGDRIIGELQKRQKVCDEVE